MQYVGRHTLDIYMLHNFFLPMSIEPVRKIVIMSSANVITQIIVDGIFAVVIVALCLLISNVMRNSNLLAYLLFGAKRVAKKKE